MKFFDKINLWVRFPLVKRNHINLGSQYDLRKFPNFDDLVSYHIKSFSKEPS